MVSFVQKVEDPAQVGIGNQQVVQSDNSYANTMSRAIGSAVDTTIRVTDKVTTDMAKAEAKEVVADAQSGVDKYVKEQEELNRINALGEEASVQEVERKSRLLAKGVKQGKITREEARLRVSELATAAIEENGFLTNKIRAATQGLLGFDPESEAVRQFFGAFEPASKSTMSAADKEDIAISQSLGMSLASVKRMRAQSQVNQWKKEQAEYKLFNDGLTTDQFIAEHSANASVDAIVPIFVQAQQEYLAGGLDAVKFNGLIEASKQTFITEGLNTLRSAGKLSLEAENKLAQQADRIFTNFKENIKDFDINNIQGRDLERISNGLTMMGMQWFPQWTAIKGAFGERLAGTMMDMVFAAGGNDAKLQALMAANPAMSRFISFQQMPVEDFNKMFFNSVGKLGNGDHISTYTPEQVALVDTYVAQALDGASPEERSVIRELLDEGGFSNKAESIVIGEDGIKIPLNSATTEEVSYINNQYELVRELSPTQIAATLAAEGNGLEVDRNGMLSIVMNQTFKGQGGRTTAMRPEESEAYAAVSKINAFLNSKGWHKELKIKATTANEFNTNINNMIESVTSTPDITESVGSGRSKRTVTRRPDAQESLKIITNSSDPEKDARRARYEELLRKRAGE